MADWDRAVVGQFSELGVQRCRAVMKFAYWWGFDTKMNKQIEIKREREREQERERERQARGEGDRRMDGSMGRWMDRFTVN
jgi:L-fucose isomerase-like protein